MKWLSVLLYCALSAQVAQQANSGYTTPEGRSQVAGNLAKESRIEDLRPKELVQSIGVKPGMTVVDLGTGVGALLPYLSEAVGAGGKVIAEDIFPDFLARAKSRAAEKGLKNVSFVLGTDTDPKLESNVADLVVTVDVYHHFDYPGEMLGNVAKSLKPGGHFVVVDMHKNDVAMPNGRAKEHIRLSADDAVKEVESHGWRLVSRKEHTPDKLWIGIFAEK